MVKMNYDLEKRFSLYLFYSSELQTLKVKT
jgi:hypothetical protein